MLSYMLPTEDKPPPGEPNQNHQKTQGNYRNTSSTSTSTSNSRLHKNPRDQYQQQHHYQQQQYHQQQQQQQQQSQAIRQKTTASTIANTSTSPKKFVDGNIRTMIVSNKIEDHHQQQQQQQQPPSSMDRHHQSQFQFQQQQQYQIQHSLSSESPKHNGTLVTKKSTLHNSNRVTKDDSLYSIDSDASTVGSDRKNKILNGAKHASLKRVSFGSSKGSMVETLVYETPVQEEPEINHFLDHNGRLPPPMIPVPDTDEGREKVRVSLLGPQPSPATPGVLLLEPIIPPIGHPIEMAAIPAELLTTHSEHTTPAYHTQISTDSGWDNPFRPDGDLSREADEIVELIKGGKPITPTPGQTAPPLPGCEETGKTTPIGGGGVGAGGDHDSSSSPLLKSNANSTNRHSNASPRLNQGNGNAHGTPIKSSTAVNSQLGNKEKLAQVRGP
ncbi:PREDICTED: putative uncharacterized protein DDB_G0282129 isoform X2 [Polistes dominula]|uniref:Uncharacterized protein n=1 Tax=Polistes dominula TaxID=743375 RepID=A0ABM1J1P1_POLDO|nr:PREDICTED: putative uncharacterized protein DDB_G0282129 isoform X2 [Polistes dominula]